MLILGRKVGESIIVGDNEMVFKVISCFKGHVRIAIEAPHYISVHREEIYKKIKNKNPGISFAAVGPVGYLKESTSLRKNKILKLNGGSNE